MYKRQPAECLSVKQAKKDELSNYSLLMANKTMPQADVYKRQDSDGKEFIRAGIVVDVKFTGLLYPDGGGVFLYVWGGICKC